MLLGMHFPIIILNKGTGGPVPGPAGTRIQCPDSGETSQRCLPFFGSDQVFGGLGDPRITQACWEGDSRKLRQSTGSLLVAASVPQVISGRQRHLRKSHTVSRTTCSEEAESHTAEEPGAHGSIRNPRLLAKVPW